MLGQGGAIASTGSKGGGAQNLSKQYNKPIESIERSEQFIVPDNLSYLNETEVVSVFPVQSVLGQHLSHDLRGRVSHRQQQCLVRHVATQWLAVDLESTTGVWSSVLTTELLQLALKLLVSPSPHHCFRVRYRPRKTRLRQGCWNKKKFKV